MPRRLALLASLAAALAVPAPALAQDPAPQQPPPEQPPAEQPPAEQRIAPNVWVSGVDVGGLLVAEAAMRLEQTLGPRLRRHVGVRAGGRSFRLTARRAKLRFDAERTAKRAYYAGKRAGTGQPEGAPPPRVDVLPAVWHSRLAVRRFVGRIARAVRRPPRNARLRITLTRMIRRQSRPGLKLDGRALARALNAALVDPMASRYFKPRRQRVRARIRASDLRRIHHTVVTISRRSFRLRLFKRLRHVRTYGIAVGAAGYETPTGLYRITNKAVNPAWSAPNKPWAGLYRGRTVPGGHPSNPLKARWLGIVNGVGIHGTAAEYSIGSRASHGCIRMRVRDVKRLYRRVPVGTPVLIR